MLLHALHIGLSFNESSGISIILLSLEFGILLLLRLILLAFSILILLVVRLTERALLVLAIFLDLKNDLQLPNPPQRLSMYLLLPNPMDCAHHERL
jgi:hypothetical protein